MVGAHGVAARGQLVDDGAVEVAVEGHGEGARYGGGGHDEDVGRHGGFLPEFAALLDAEAVLFVDDHEAEVAEGDVVLDEGVGADEEVDCAVGELLFKFLFGGGAQGSREELHVDAEAVEHALEGEEVLSGEDFGGRHEAGLAAVVDG